MSWVIRVSLLVVTTLLAGCRCPVKRASALQSPAEVQTRRWWFPSGQPTGAEITYRLTHTAYADDETGAPWKLAEHTLTLVAGREDGKAGCLFRAKMTDPKDALQCWLAKGTWLGDRQLRITLDAVLLDDRPLLRGPWREGDRMTVFVPFPGGLLATHGVARSATPGGVAIELELWARWFYLPSHDWTGHGHIRITSDADGVASALIELHQSAGQYSRRHVIQVDRTAFRPPQVEESPSDRS